MVGLAPSKLEWSSTKRPREGDGKGDPPPLEEAMDTEGSAATTESAEPAKGDDGPESADSDDNPQEAKRVRHA